MTSQGRQLYRKTTLHYTACFNKLKTCTRPQSMRFCTNPTILLYLLQNICIAPTLILYIYLAYSFCVNHFHRIFYFNVLNTAIYNVNNFQGYLILNPNTSWSFCRCNDYAVLNNIHTMNWAGSARKQSAYLLTSAWRIRGNYKWSFWCSNWEVNQDH
jgi:hypothetical protein